MNKEQISAITMSVTLSYFVVVAMLQQNIQAYLYSQPPPGSDYKQYKVGWDQAQADAYYDQGNGKYRDYLSGADCHTYRGLLSRIHGRISRVCRQEFTSPSRPVECSREQWCFDGNNNRVEISYTVTTTIQMMSETVTTDRWLKDNIAKNLFVLVGVLYWIFIFVSNIKRRANVKTSNISLCNNKYAADVKI